jgi:excisionase family DNA binding protein
MFKKEKRSKKETVKTLDMDASMQGKLAFSDPVDLKISGKFEGSLDTKGSLTIGDGAVVNAQIKGENIVISGKVVGNISATVRLTLSGTACVIGDITTGSLIVEEGAFLQGNCHMMQEEKNRAPKKQILNRRQLAEYLEIDSETLDQWIENRKIPAFQENNEWRFDKSKIDAWVASEKIK